MEGQESSGSDTHQGKLQKYLDLCTHPDVRGFKGHIRVYMREWVEKLCIENNACF